MKTIIPEPDELVEPDTTATVVSSITTYDATGHLLVSKTIMGVIDDLVAPGGLYVDGLHDSRKEYVDLSVVPRVAIPRPRNPTNQRDTTLFNIPMPSQIVIDDKNYGDVTDSTVEFEFLLPGTYTITVVSFPPLDATFTMVRP